MRITADNRRIAGTPAFGLGLIRQRPMRDDTAPPGVEVIGHRGVRTLEKSRWREIAPENTLSSFAAAHKMGASLELDVVPTSDGIPVIHHDFKTGRVFSVPGGDSYVPRLPLAALKSANVNPARYAETIRKIVQDDSFTLNPKFHNETIPTLEEVFNTFPDSRIYAEVKIYSHLPRGKTASPKFNEAWDNLMEMLDEWETMVHYVMPHNNKGVEENIVRLIQKKNLYKNVIVTSDMPWIVRKVKKLDPNVKTGLGMRVPPVFEDLAFAFFLRMASGLKVSTLHMPYWQAKKEWIEKAHKKGIRVILYAPGETPREHEGIMLPGVLPMKPDGITTNAPDILQSVLKSN